MVRAHLLGHDLAKGWHVVARGAKKAGHDITTALKKSAHTLDGTAKWSGTKLKGASYKTTEALKHMGGDAKIGAEKTGQWFKDIGKGIKDVGHHTKGS